METQKVKRHLLIDADVLAYQAAASVERIVCWEEDLCLPVASVNEAVVRFEEKLTDVCTTVPRTEGFTLCFSDSAENNFRRKLYPAYKSNRAGKPRPVALKFLRERLLTEYRCQVYHGLEADDVLGILATDTGFMPVHEKVIVSVDKDMKTIPCNFFDMNKGFDEEGEPVIQRIYEPQADHWFLTQTLTGDSTDGYAGCPKYGPVTAAKLFQKVLAEEVISSGTSINAVQRYWPAIVQAYAKAGFGEEYALTMARLARILRVEDYDYKNQEVILWKP